ncbi:CDP-alcohol phosphatidyltransferase family protein [Corynebacterium sp. H128]|uniref:phosphatidylinositol phosphate synthase n=1 Tax=unclassified Corynebacterium TaxID=2624378 RepID=UPI00309D190A
MLSVHGRKPAAVIIEPVARALLKAGLSPNVVTVGSTLIACAIVLVLVPTGHLFLAALLSGLVTAFDMVDGTMARLRGGGTTFGATLDASCDRITDGVLFSVILWWLIYQNQAPQHVVIAAFIVLVSSQVISYVKARAEAGGIKIVGGLIERPERLILGLLGLGMAGLGLPWALVVALWLLAVGSLITIVQRLIMAARDPIATEFVAPPAGSKEAAS